MSNNQASNVAAALAALQSQLPLAPLLLPNQLGLGNLTAMSPQDLNAFQQAFQQVQQASLQQQLQTYMELMHGSAGMGQQKNANSASAQAQAAAQFFQVTNRFTFSLRGACPFHTRSLILKTFSGRSGSTTIASITKATTN